MEANELGQVIGRNLKTIGLLILGYYFGRKFVKKRMKNKKNVEEDD